MGTWRDELRDFAWGFVICVCVLALALLVGWPFGQLLGIGGPMQ
jgi:hypothetical protein